MYFCGKFLGFFIELPRNVLENHKIGSLSHPYGSTDIFFLLKKNKIKVFRYNSIIIDGLPVKIFTIFFDEI